MSARFIRCTVVGLAGFAVAVALLLLFAFGRVEPDSASSGTDGSDASASTNASSPTDENRSETPAVKPPPAPVPVPKMVPVASKLTAERDKAKTQDVLTDLARTVDPSIVTVEVTDRGQGSGFVFDKKGLIVTNYHVIEGAKEAAVAFHDKRRAKVVGFLAIAPGKDLAVLRIDAAGFDLRPLAMAEVAPRKGQRVAAFGAPLGLTGTISEGIVSAVRTGDELVEIAGNDFYTKLMEYDRDAVWLQTTAPISPGNSGGPLVDMDGRAVGVNTWAAPSGENLNFAACVSHVRSLASARDDAIQPLASLPTPRRIALARQSGDAKRTLAFWNQLRIIGQLGALNLRRLQLGRKRTSATAAINQLEEAANTLLVLAGRIEQLDTTQVDAQLLLTANALVTFFRDGASAIREGVVIVRQSTLAASMQDEDGLRDAQQKFIQLSEKVNQINDVELLAKLQGMHTGLSRRYGIVFPPVSVDIPEIEDKKADRALRLARNLYSAQRTEEAQRRLREIIAKYPNTKAADEAKALLVGEQDARTQSNEREAQDGFRTWTDSTGQFRVQAQYLETINDQVRLRRSDNKIVSIPLERLSEADQRFVRESQKP